MRPLRRLFEPIHIGGLRLRNRLVMSPMTTGYATDDGLPSPRLIAYLEARARGGVGLVTTEACTVDRRHREVPRSMHFSDDSVIPLHREITDRIHAHGASVQPQIVHPGPDGLSPFLEKIPAVGPSVIPSYLTGVPSRALEAAEIRDIVRLYGDTARRVREAGYDGLELHAAHGYMLLGSFLSPWRNRREDEYTGKTSEGRTRILREVLSAIRYAAGEDFPVTLRISGYERVPGGRPIADTQQIAPGLVANGVDAFHVSGGVIDRLTTQIVTGSHYPDGHNVAAAAAVRSVVDVPVMAVGRIHDPLFAEAILERGQADLIAMGRPLLADPELPNKARAGSMGQLRRCISCQTCIDSMEVGRMACAVNAFSGRELDLSTEPVSAPKRVLVVGGGPGGLEAARVAALRGHDVTLVERERHLGGALVLAATVHPENETLLSWLVDEVRRLPVAVRLGQTATPDWIRGLSPDAAIVATGGRVVSPRLSGDEQPHVLKAAALAGWLRGEANAAEDADGTERTYDEPTADAAEKARPGGPGRPALPSWQRVGARWLGASLSRVASPARIRGLANLWMPLGERVVIVGADLAALELAEFLAGRSRRVTVLASGDAIAPEVGGKRRAEHMDRLDRLGVAINTGVEITGVEPRGVAIRPAGSVEDSRVVEADTVVLAGEVEPNPLVFDEVRAIVPECYAVGDCTGLGLVAKAIREAAQAACSL